MSLKKAQKKPYIIPVLLIMAVMMVLGMVRLGVWQLDRAAQKQSLLDQVTVRSQSTRVSLESLLPQLRENSYSDLRFQPVALSGVYLPDASILIENQVVNKNVGYKVITPFKPDGLDVWIMVERGWVAAGVSRSDLPSISTPEGQVTLSGRLNFPPAKPPLWREGFPVNEGIVWQYLPINDYARQFEVEVLPLMVELAPDNPGSRDLVVRWQAINDEWVAKHKGYAFQWFAMALAFTVACVVLLLRSRRPSTVVEQPSDNA